MFKRSTLPWIVVVILAIAFISYIAGTRGRVTTIVVQSGPAQNHPHSYSPLSPGWVKLQILHAARAGQQASRWLISSGFGPPIAYADSTEWYAAMASYPQEEWYDSYTGYSGYYASEGYSSYDYYASGYEESYSSYAGYSDYSGYYDGGGYYYDPGCGSGYSGYSSGSYGYGSGCGSGDPGGNFGDQYPWLDPDGHNHHPGDHGHGSIGDQGLPVSSTYIVAEVNPAFNSPLPPQDTKNPSAHPASGSIALAPGPHKPHDEHPLSPVSQDVAERTISHPWTPVALVSNQEPPVRYEQQAPGATKEPVKMIAEETRPAVSHMAQNIVVPVRGKNDQDDKVQEDAAQIARENAERERAEAAADAARIARQRAEEEHAQRERENAQRAADERAEQERINRENAQRAAQERAEQERINRENAERAANIRAEQERIEREREAADRAARERAEQERISRENAERAAHERAEQERAAREREAADRAARERAEQERISRENAERAAHERAEQERVAREREEAHKRETMSSSPAGKGGR